MKIFERLIIEAYIWINVKIMAATVALNLFAFRIITLNAEIFQNGNKRLEQTHHRGGK